MFAASKVAGAAAAASTTYIEDVFSTYLYRGNGSTQTITNNIDLSTKGGLIWTKARSTIGGNWFCDTARGNTKYIFSNGTSAQSTYTTQITSFNTTGFSLGSEANANESSQTFASWTFRKQPKFFDIVTYTGNGSVSRAINHSLGSVPGCIIVKCTSTATNWPVYHRGLNGGVNPEQYAAYLNLTNDGTGGGRWANTAPTSTQFYVNNDGTVNTNGATYVAYIFAHNAGGFGLTGTDNVISCGSYTGNGGLNSISLGYEAQWVLIKNTSTGTSVSNWALYDNMRGWANNGTDQQQLRANLSDAETASGVVYATATGFGINDGSSRVNGSGENYIYIAIRRGPMKVPTDSTKVFVPLVASNPKTTNFPVDFVIEKAATASVSNNLAGSRLQGTSAYLITNTTDAEQSQAGFWDWASNTKVTTPNQSGAVDYAFGRSPSFFDEVCYTGNDTARTLNHNLGVAPELMIVKSRSGAANWTVYSAAVGNTKYLQLNTTAAPGTLAAIWNNTSPTSSVFTVGTNVSVNGSGSNYVAYLFATCLGVSKVGSYTGTGATQTIACGFTGGARFVLIKRTNSTGDWWVWDTARGMVSGTDPSLLLNSTAAEVNANSIYTTTGGFQIVSTAAGINANGGTYIYLAIA